MPSEYNYEDLVKYHKILNELPVLICCFLPDGEIVYVNGTYCKYFGYTDDELVGSNFQKLIPDADRKMVMSNISALTAASPRQSHIHSVIRPNGDIGWQRWTNHAIFDGQGNLTEYFSVGEDITERRQALEMLSDSEQLHRIILANISDAVLITDDAGCFTYICPNVKAIFGYSYEEVKSRGNIDKLMGGPLFDKIDLKSRGEIRNIEHSIYDKSHVTHNILVNVKQVSIKSGTILYSCRDVTERKKAEKALNDSQQRLRDLSSQLLKAQEIERRCIAMEIHDQIGPDLAVLKIQLKGIADKLREDQGRLKEALNESMYLLNLTFQDLRRLSRDLSPTMIEELKLGRTLRWMLNDFQKHWNIDVSMDLADIDDQFCHDEQIIIYRIFQEALNNICKHAQANHVGVVIKKEDGQILFRIEDDGNGFNFEEAIHRHVAERGMGLTALYERVNMLGGTLDLNTRKGIGTRISFVIPQQGFYHPT
jgi:PAS domain S-box-containing protein